MNLSQDLRRELREPFGTLITNTTRENVLRNIAPGVVLVTVGDATSEKITEFGVVPRLQIVDGVEKRVRRNIPNIPGIISVRCKNRPSEISQDCIETIRRCLASESPSRIIIDGEEDLLVIPVCIHAPVGTIVMYGQPNVGLVIVHVDSETRNRAISLLDSVRGHDEKVAE